MSKRLAAGSCAALSLAGSAVGQLWSTGPFDGVSGRSSDRPTPAVRPETRAADDFVLATGNGRAYGITGVHARALGRNYSAVFAEVYADNAGQPAAAPLATLPPGSLQVLQTGVFGQYDLIEATFAVAPGTLDLPPGRYWLALVCDVSGDPAPGDGYGFFATAGGGALEGLEGRYRIGQGDWTPITVAFGFATDFSFQVDGQQQPSACYVNCDASTIPPILNIADFICFQQKFVSGDSYANCDGSTIAPVLNIADFICFQQHFVQGCP